MTAMHTIGKQYGRAKDRYLDLIERFPLKPIRSEAENDAALAVCKELMGKAKPGSPESDYLNILVTLVEDFEEEEYPFEGDLSDAEVINTLLDDRDLTQAQFAKAVGMATSTVSEIFNGKRELTRKQLEKVSDYFKVSMDLFRTRRKA